MPFSKSMWAQLAKETGLSPRQEQIVLLLFKGYSDKQIAHDLGIGMPTVRTHMSRLFTKLDASDRCELLIRFFKESRRLCHSVDCPLFSADP